MTGPIDYDRLFNRSPLAPKVQAPDTTVQVGIDYDLLFGRKKTPQETATKLIDGIEADALDAVGQPEVAPYDASIFAPRAPTPRERGPLSLEMTGLDRIMRAGAEAIGGGRPGETRPERLTREAVEYATSPEKRAVDLENTASISAAPGIFGRARQKLASMRLFTDRSIVEFDNGNSTGFHIGIPFASPLETAKQLVTGLPKFFADLAAHPAKLYIEAATGGQYLLPEEKKHVIRETVANYAGLIQGAVTGQAVRSMLVGREFLKTGAASMSRRGLVDQIPIGELELIGKTLPRALTYEVGIPGQAIIGAVEGIAGGATTGSLLGNTPEESRNLAATYALMAMPAGIAFEGIMGRIRDRTAGIHVNSAMHAGALSVMRQFQDAAAQSERNAASSFLALKGADDIAEAARQANMDRPVVVQGVKNYTPDGTEIIHTRPDGLKDIAFGGLPDITPVIDAPPVRAIDIPPQITGMSDDGLDAAIAVTTARLDQLTDPADITEVSDLLAALKHERETRIPLPDIVAQARTGEGTVGATLDKSLLKKLGANLYKNGIANTIIKEGIQNAVDAIRPVNGGVVVVDVNTDQGRFSFRDTGTGMDPETAANEFMDVGGSKKPAGASGGYGLAKVGLLSNAEHFRMETVAQTKEGKKRTVIEGSSDDWVNGTLRYEVTDAPKNVKTGTTLDIDIPTELMGDSYRANSFLGMVIEHSRGVGKNIIRKMEQGVTIGKPDDRKVMDTFDLPNATLEVLHASTSKEFGQYEQLPVHVLNNGLYQFTMHQPVRGVVPEHIVVDVQPKVTVSDDSYPFTTSREELKSGVDDQVKRYLKTLSVTAARDEAFGLIQTLRESPSIPGSTGARLMDTSRKLPAEVFDAVLNDPSLPKLADSFSDALATISLALEAKREQMVGAHRTFLNYTAGGIGIGKGYLGLNISSTALNQVAAAAGIPDTGVKNNVILVNPFEIYGEILRADAEAPGAVPLSTRLADHTVGTLVHELVHEQARSHDEAFSGQLTRAIGVVLKELPEIHQTLSVAWELALKVPKGPGEFAFDASHDLLRKEWENNRGNAFKSISSDLAGTGDDGSAISGPDAGDQLPARQADTPVSAGAEAQSRAPVQAGSQIEGVGSGPSDLPGAVAQRRRALAQATFEVAGFFPDETVGFLGSEYRYIEPVIGKNGKLTHHILEDGDGNRVEVPWDQVRHGPDMAVNTFVLDKPGVRKALVDDFERFVKKIAGEDALPDKPFSDTVTAYITNKRLNPRVIGPLVSFLGNEYARRLRDEALSPMERATYQRISKEMNNYRELSANNLVDAATSNGMYIERQNGALIIRDSENGAYLELAHSPEEALAFINSVAEERSADFTQGGLPDAVARGLIPVPPPPNGPHTTAWNPNANGWGGDLRDLFSTSSLGTRFTGMRQIMISLDNQLQTEFSSKVWDSLYRSHLQKFAAMHDDITRVSGTAKMARGLTPEQLEQVTTSIETMSPDEMIRPGGLFKRGFTPRELAAANWFVSNQIDLKKAWQYFRGLKNLEQKKRFQTLPEGDKVDTVHRLQASLNVDEAHIEAARILGAIIRKNTPGTLSVYGVVRLAESIMDGHLDPDAYIGNHFPAAITEEGRKMRLLRDEIKSHFADLANKFDIPDEKRLGGYFAHLRNYANDEIIAGRDGAPVFTSELLRTGEMVEYDRDPINVLVRYINAGYSGKFTREALDNAYEYINMQTAKMVDPAHGDYIRRLLVENYVDELRGIPHASTGFTEKLLNKFLDKINVGNDISVRRDAINTFLSLTSSSTIGFRPMQGIRDFHNFTSIYYSRFGAERLTSLLTMMSRVTPRELEQAGIIGKSQIGESVPETLSREGITPTLGPVSVLSPQERLQNTIAARTAPYRAVIQDVAEAGIKWGLQHNVYQWAHAAVFLETSTRAMRELNALASLEYGAGVEGKQRAYDNLFINSYDPPVAAEFDRLVSAGKFKEAAEFLGRATSFETVSVFGLANHPAGWGTNTGRLFGQFGNWPVWARTTLARMLTRGTRQERTRVAARFGMTQGALALASSGLGLNLNSWFLPGVAPLFSGIAHLGAAAQSYDDEQTREYQQAAAALILGVPGSTLYRGGPAFSQIGAGLDAAQAYPEAEREAGQALTQAPLLAVPGGYLLRDIAAGIEMAKNGDNPLSAWFRAFGVRSTEEESLLNPTGIVAE